MQKILLILNDPPYGTERSYNGLRLARKLLEGGKAEVNVFLFGDATACAKAGQKVPQGYYNIGDMLGAIIRKNASVAACGSCLDARGIAADNLVEGAVRGTMDMLSEWTVWADKVAVF